MASDKTIRDELVTRLRTVDGLTGYDHVPGRVNLPAAVVQRRRTAFDATMARGSDDFEYFVTVMVPWADMDLAQELMSAYLDTASDKSIKAAVEGGGGNLGGSVDWVRVREAGEEEIREVAGIQVLAVDFTVEATA